jgi:hypothetical protein
VTHQNRRRLIAYWLFTLPIAFENAAGAMWVFSQFIPGINQTRAASVFAEYLRVMLGHLGYPLYFQYLLGPWQLACAAALLAPGLPRVKEWAYAGAFFNYSAAFVSHAFAGDSPDVASAVFAVLTVVSWALRPADRRVEATKSMANTTPSSWIAAAGLLLLLLIMSFTWLPPVPKQ